MEKTAKVIKQVCAIVAVCVMLFAIAQAVVWRDEQVNQAADKYEECVAKTYHTTPSAWYQEYGEYPECR